MADWGPISTAPKDGTKIDLLYPYPRGRKIDCFWDDEQEGWFWRNPTWGESGDKNGLLPEDKWDWACLCNMEPTHWMRPPSLPSPIEAKESP